MSNKPWTIREIEYVKEHYGSCSTRELSNRLGRTRGAITLKACQLRNEGYNIPYSYENVQWTNEDNQWIIENYNSATKEELLSRFPNRSIHAIRRQRGVLIDRNEMDANNGRNGRAWTMDEIRFLRDYSGTMSIPDMAKALNRSYNSVSGQLHKQRSYDDLIFTRKPYTKEEDDYLIANVSKLTPGQMATILNRSERSVQSRMYKLRLKKSEYNTARWTKEEDKFVLDNHNAMTHADMAEELNRATTSVSSRISLLIKKGLIQKREIKEWTKQEEQLLIEHYFKCSKSELLKLLPGRTWSSISSRMRNLVRANHAPKGYRKRALK